MKFFSRLFRIFRRNRMEEDRRKEMNYRMKAADARRRAETMKRASERAAAEALRLQAAGDHNGAVSKALEARNGEQQYQSALARVRACESLYEQFKTNKDMIGLMDACNKMTQEVTGQVDTNEIVKVQQEFQNANVVLDTMQDTLSILQEGFEPAVDPAVRNAEGEAALAALLASAQPEKAPVKEEPAEMPAAAEKAAQENAEGQQADRDYREYLSGMRKEVVEMM